MKNFATFDAAFPDRPETDPEGEVVRAGGYELAVAIAQLLATILPVVDRPKEHSWYGWQIAASDHDRQYWLMLQRSDQWLLIAEDRTGLLRRMRSSTRLPAILEKLARRFAEDRRFSNVSWLTKEDFEKGASSG